ncbi:endoplasmic reticulum membrane protein [Ceratobasidium sp. AG-Ba]|nr:endoplasmic reticulum membrane protein [Ceratobasidium sp. AG-Ba]
MPSKLFDVNHQLAFYGAYHSNKINIAIHHMRPNHPMDGSGLPGQRRHPPNWAFIFSMIYIVYYYALEPVAAALYTPQFTLSCLSAIAFAQRPDAIKVAGALHAFSWIMQFIGHGAAEGRAPALLDNLVGAIVLAPFFVHLELLFAIGYNPSLHKRIQNEVGKQITQFRRQEADKKRAAGRKDL